MGRTDSEHTGASDVKMRIHGTYDDKGELITYVNPWDGVVFGNTIRDPLDGMVLAIKDEYGDWVSSTMYSVGVRRLLKVEELATNVEGGRRD